MDSEIIVFKSALHSTESLEANRQAAVRRHFSDRRLMFVNYEDGIAIATGAACFIATGGTEELFTRVWENLPRPVVLVSDGYHNSFAAAREIASFLAQQGVEHTLVNLPLEDGDAKATGRCESTVLGTVSDLCHNPYAEPRVLDALANARIGLIGGASSWLVSSGIDRGLVCGRFGCKFIDIPISEVEDLYSAVAGETSMGEPSGMSAGTMTGAEASAIGGTAAGSAAKETTGAAATGSARTYSPEALSDAERMYHALKAVCLRYRLTALTIKCFDLLDSCRTTSCLALARLSDEGIISGCEGDIPSLWTLLVAKALTGHPAFMANPSSSNADECTVDFAHCTIPISMCTSYSLPSHFESGIGIGIAGIIPEGPCKLLKIGGPALDRIYTAEGEIICNTRIAARCRTQIRFRFADREEFDRFMDCRLGNHIILYR